MEINSFQDMYLAELEELYSAEAQVAGVLQRMANVAQHDELKQTLMGKLEDARIQKERLETVITRHNADPREHRDQAMEALVQESEKMMAMLRGPALLDAGIIASAQKLEHYEIAAYGTAAAFAGQLGFEEDQQRLHQTLEEKKGADIRLTEIAKKVVNPEAVA